MTLTHPTAAYEAWLQATRFHLTQGTLPEHFDWQDDADAPSFFGAPQPTHIGERFPISMALAPRIRLPEAFEDKAKLAAMHRSGHRWRALYRVAWRLVHGESRLMDKATDTDVFEITKLAREVEAELRKVRTQVRWMIVRHGGHVHRAAWLDPRHHVLTAAAPYWVRKMGATPWSVLSPERCIHWDGHQLFETSGVPDASPHPDQQEVEQLWRRHAAVSFTRAPAPALAA